jgi:hypothetical protein
MIQTLCWVLVATLLWVVAWTRCSFADHAAKSVAPFM